MGLEGQEVRGKEGGKGFGGGERVEHLVLCQDWPAMKSDLSARSKVNSNSLERWVRSKSGVGGGEGGLMRAGYVLHCVSGIPLQ